jgi:hypothetical protein
MLRRSPDRYCSTRPSILIYSRVSPLRRWTGCAIADTCNHSADNTRCDHLTVDNNGTAHGIVSQFTGVSGRFGAATILVASPARAASRTLATQLFSPSIRRLPPSSLEEPPRRTGSAESGERLHQLRRRTQQQQLPERRRSPLPSRRQTRSRRARSAQRGFQAFPPS